MMEAYLCAFVNWEQNDGARLLPITKFAYNNSKNASMYHIFFKLNYSYYLLVSFQNKCDKHSRSSSTKRLAMEWRKLMNVCRQNFLHAQDLKKQAHDKKVKPRSYILGKKVWFNSKHIKTKRNQKLEVKFFGPFQVFHPVGKQIYKLELPTKYGIHDVFHVLLLE